MNATFWKEGDEINERYKITGFCGRGNYGEVWKAYDTRLDRDVALKRIYPLLPAQPAVSAQAVLEEGRKQASIRSSNIAKIIDVPSDSDYMVMEYYPSSLRTELRNRIKGKQGPFPYNKCKRIFKRCVQAVSDIHKAGRVHGDIKPGNILLDDHGRPQLSDFGIARSMEEQGFPHALGSATWAAPEVWERNFVDERSDLFSLGVTIYLLFTNSHPFHADDPSRLITEEDNIKDPDFNVKPLKLVRPGVEDWIDEVVMKLLSREPKVREAGFKIAEQGKW